MRGFRSADPISVFSFADRVIDKKLNEPIKDPLAVDGKNLECMTRPTCQQRLPSFLASCCAYQRDAGPEFAQGKTPTGKKFSPRYPGIRTRHGSGHRVASVHWLNTCTVTPRSSRTVSRILSRCARHRNRPRSDRGENPRGRFASWRQDLPPKGTPRSASHLHLADQFL